MPLKQKLKEHTFKTGASISSGYVSLNPPLFDLQRGDRKALHDNKMKIITERFIEDYFKYINIKL